MSSKKRLTLITGAAGMIGSGVVRALNDQGDFNLLLVDDLKESNKWKNLVGKQFVSLISRHKLFEWLKGKESEIDAVIHLGACSDTTETNGDYLLENNYHYSIRLAEWALSHNKRFLYASSAATYGDGSRGFSDDENQIEELKPLNLYGFSKQLVDLWMKREKVLDRVVGLKYFNVFGPNEQHKGKMASMVFKMTHIANQEGVIGLYKSNDPLRFADGDQKRDFIYLKDAVRMTLAFLDPEHQNIGGIYNIGRGEPVTWNFLAASLFKALLKPKRVVYIDMPKELLKQYQNYTSADMQKFRRAFSSNPKALQRTPVEAAVLEYVQEYLIKDQQW